MSKKGELEVTKTSHAASLILIIFLFLLGYLLLIPSSEREKLISGGEAEEGAKEAEGIKTLLVKSPGYLSPYEASKEEKKIGSISLYSTVEKDTEKLANSLYVSRNIFKNNEQKISFKIEDVSDLQSLGLLFNLMESKGELIVRLNDNAIYQGRAESYELPVDLPVDMLGTNNEIKLTASSPGVNIFGSNYFDLRDVYLIRNDVLENTKEERVFAADKDKISSNAEISFYVNCLKVGKKQGVLRVSLNDKNVYSGRISCDASLTKIDVRKEYILDKDNTLKFEIDTGEYRVEDLKVSYSLKGGENPMYYFNVEDEDANKEFELRLKFGAGDVKDIKRATLFVNGAEFSMVAEEEQEEFVKDISNLIKEGENYIKIIPKNGFEVTHLEVVLVE